MANVLAFFLFFLSYVPYLFMELLLTITAMSYVSHMRSNLSLMRRSSSVRSVDIETARSSVLSYLANKVLIYPPSMRDVGLSPDMSFVDRKAALGIRSGSYEETSYETEFRHHLEASSRKSRRSNWIWRIGSECEEMRDKGWFPFFVTLTVDPSRCSDSLSMWKEGTEFRRYIRRLARVSASACGQLTAIKDGVSAHLFVRHVGIIEHGKSNHHHHMHLLIWMRGIPEKWKICPNRGISNPSSRVINFCRQMGTYWPLALPGIGKAIYFRHEGDIWSRLGFCVPIKRETGKVPNIMPARMAGVYVAKYMEKEDKAWLHRVKATRNLGMERLQNLLFQMGMRHLQALTWRPRKYSLSTLLTTIHSVPSGLVRSTAKRIYFCRAWANKSLDLKELLRPNTDSFTGMLKSVRDGARPNLMSSPAFYAWVTEHLPVPNDYCDKRIGAAHLQLRPDFPVFHGNNINHLGGMSHE